MRTIGVDSTLGIVTLRVNAVDKEVGDNGLGASRLLGQTQMTVTVLLDEDGALAQPASNESGILEGSGGIGLVSDDNDGVLQGAVPWTGVPFHSTSGPSVAEMARLRELDADWT